MGVYETEGRSRRCAPPLMLSVRRRAYIVMCSNTSLISFTTSPRAAHAMAKWRTANLTPFLRPILRLVSLALLGFAAYACGSPTPDVIGRWVNPDSLDAGWPLFYHFEPDGKFLQAERNCTEIGLAACRYEPVPIDTLMGQWQLRRSNGRDQLCLATHQPIRCYRITVLSVGTVQELRFGPQVGLPKKVLDELPATIKSYRRVPN